MQISNSTMTHFLNSHHSELQRVGQFSTPRLIMTELLLDFPLAGMITVGFALCGLATALLVQCGNKRKAPKKKGKSAKSIKGRSKNSSRNSSKKSSRSSKRSKSLSGSAKSKAKVTSKPKQKSNRSSKNSGKEAKEGTVTPKVARTPSQDSDKGAKREWLSLKSLQEMPAKIETADNNDQLQLHVEPRVLRFSEQGGLSKVQLHNPTNRRQAIKVKCSDNAIYRVNPVYGVVEPGQKFDVEVLRQGGSSKVDKLVFLTAKAPSESFDVKKFFKSAPKEETPRLVLPLLG